MSDLETDAANQEIDAAKMSPWPEDMRDGIWTDRLLLRYRMKKEMRGYRHFLEEVVRNHHHDGDDATTPIDIKKAIPILHNFCTKHLTPFQLRQIFQLPRSELPEILKTKYKIHASAYAIVFCTVVEQVANFHVTKYPVDGRRFGSSGGGGCDLDDAEVEFEVDLRYDKFGPGFYIGIIDKNDDGDGATSTSGDDNNNSEECCWRVNETVLLRFLQRMVSLGGPTLLARAAKTSHDNQDDSDDDDEEENNSSTTTTPPAVGSNVPSFRSDRRVIRLLIARYWADGVMEKYRESQQMKEKKKEGGTE